MFAPVVTQPWSCPPRERERREGSGERSRPRPGEPRPGAPQAQIPPEALATFGRGGRDRTGDHLLPKRIQ